MDGPCYLRANRNDYDNTTAEDAPFEIGVPTVLREGSDIAVFACGYMLNLALEAAAALEKQVSVKVINLSTIKPLNEDLIRSMVTGIRGVVTVEEHSVIGGLGSAITEALRRERIPIEMVGVKDVFGCSAHNYQEVLNAHGLTAAHIQQAIRSLL